jgi:hypothetical protein
MKNKSSSRELSYIYTQQIQDMELDNMIELVWLDSEMERSNGELENILR